MAAANVQDIIIPQIFLPYTTVRTAELSAFVQSGVVDNDAEFATLAADGGQTANMPYFKDLEGDDEIVGRSGDVAVDGITTDKDVSIKCIRQKAFGAHDLAGLLAGADPMTAIANLVAAFWVRKDQQRLLKILEGVFSIASMAALVHAIHHTSGGTATVANYFTGKTFIDAKQLLGDAKEKLSAIAMHSATEASLAKQDLIDTIPDSMGTGTVKMFQGMRVIVDDGLPVATVDSDTVYTTFIFAQGAVAFGESTADMKPVGAVGTWRLEYDRVARQSTSNLIMRRKFIQHIRGVKWLSGTMAADSPTNAELATANNWLRVYDTKQLRVIKFTHNIA